MRSNHLHGFPNLKREQKKAHNTDAKQIIRAKNLGTEDPFTHQSSAEKLPNRKTSLKKQSVGKNSRVDSSPGALPTTKNKTSKSIPKKVSSSLGSRKSCAKKSLTDKTSSSTSEEMMMMMIPEKIIHIVGEPLPPPPPDENQIIQEAGNPCIDQLDGRVVILKDPTDSSCEQLNFQKGQVVDRIPEGTNGESRSRKPLNVKNTDNGSISVDRIFLHHLQSVSVEPKKSVSGLLNTMIEETASKLVRTRKSKVKALVGAFQSVINLHHSKSSSTSFRTI